ncbi:MAG: hypothetical protein B6U94_04380 [Thermofilum sp. ex4484_79]|nr:MAG: hypothetical protein B6U94_04380 [Thermofilum sp. ex4484_79]
MDKIKRLAIFAAVVMYLIEKRGRRIKKMRKSINIWSMASRFNFDEERYYKELFQGRVSRW